MCFYATQSTHIKTATKLYCQLAPWTIHKPSVDSWFSEVSGLADTDCLWHWLHPLISCISQALICMGNCLSGLETSQHARANLFPRDRKTQYGRLRFSMPHWRSRCSHTYLWSLNYWGRCEGNYRFGGLVLFIPVCFLCHFPILFPNPTLCTFWHRTARAGH